MLLLLNGFILEFCDNAILRCCKNTSDNFIQHFLILIVIELLISIIIMYIWV